MSALCSRVLVLAQGDIRFDGRPSDLAAVAEGRVWAAEDEAVAGAAVSWRTGDGLLRHVGSPPPGATLVPPSLEDGYLLLLAQSSTSERAA